MPLTDPVHFFNARGVSVLLAEDQAAQIAELKAENERLKGLLNKALVRLREESRISEIRK